MPASLGLTQDTAARYITVVRVVNTDPAAPTGALRISDINIVNADGTAKADEVHQHSRWSHCLRRLHLYTIGGQAHPARSR